MNLQTDKPNKPLKAMLDEANAQVLASEKAQVEILTDMTREQWNALADTKLQELLQTSSGALLLAVIRESKDRIEGKPAQTLQVDATLRQITVNATIKFADEIPVSRDKLIIDHVDKPQTIDSK